MKYRLPDRSLGKVTGVIIISFSFGFSSKLLRCFLLGFFLGGRDLFFDPTPFAREISTALRVQKTRYADERKGWEGEEEEEFEKETPLPLPRF